MAYQDVVLADTPLGYWRLEEDSGNFADSSGNSYLATPGNNLTRGLLGVIAQGDRAVNRLGVGSNQCIGSVPDAAAFRFGAGSFSYELWLAKETIFSPGVLGCKYLEGTAFPEWWISAISETQIRVEFRTSNVATPTYIHDESLVGVSLGDGSRHHIVLVRDGSANVFLYVDSVQYALPAFSGTLWSSANPTAIGGLAGSGVSTGCEAKFDEIAIYNYALSASRVLAHWVAGTSSPTPPAPPRDTSVKVPALPRRETKWIDENETPGVVWFRYFENLSRLYPNFILDAPSDGLFYARKDAAWNALSVFTSDAQGIVPASGGGTTNFLRADGTWAAPSGGGGGGGGGTVTSVALTAPSIFSVSGSPVTTAGTVALNFVAQSANVLFAGPASGAAASPTFRNLVAEDLPLFTSALAGAVPASGGGTTNFLRADGTWTAPSGGGGSGTVTSVALTAPGIFSVAGSPVTTAGTLALSFVTQSANLLFAGPASGAAASPTFRSLVPADLPLFTSALAGAVPGSGGGTTNFLRADGTWTAPSGGGSPGGSNTQVQFNNAGAFGGTSSLVWDSANSILRHNGAAASAKTVEVTSGVSDSNFRLQFRNGVSGSLSGTLQAKFGLWYDSGAVENAVINFYRGSSTSGGYLAIAINGTERLAFDTSGNIAITASTLSLSNATSNLILWNTSGVNAPTFTTRSAGAKLVLYPQITAASADYALGIEGSTLWYGVPTTSERHRWYAGTTQIMQLAGSGVLDLTGASRAIQMNGTQVLANRITGWGAPTGTVSRAALTLTAAVGYVQADFDTVIQSLKAVITDLRAHGLINT